MTVPGAELEKTENKVMPRLCVRGGEAAGGAEEVRRGTGKGASAICIAGECEHLQLDVGTIAHTCE